MLSGGVARVAREVTGRGVQGRLGGEGAFRPAAPRCRRSLSPDGGDGGWAFLPSPYLISLTKTTPPFSSSPLLSSDSFLFLLVRAGTGLLAFFLSRFPQPSDTDHRGGGRFLYVQYKLDSPVFASSDRREGEGLSEGGKGTKNMGEAEGAQRQGDVAMPASALPAPAPAPVPTPTSPSPRVATAPHPCSLSASSCERTSLARHFFNTVRKSSNDIRL